MPKCKKSEGTAIDYAAKLLPPAEAAPFETHLEECPDCHEAVQSFSTVLALVDTAESAPELDAPMPPLENIEMRVYKRLAATQQETLFSRVRQWFVSFGSLFQWQRTAAASTVVVALITVALIMGNPFRTAPELKSTEIQSADARMEQYRQQDIQRNLEEALITDHLRNDTWETESRLHRMKEQAHGTDWTKVADEHLQNLQPGS